jgi:hypothetical protein
MSDYGGTDDPYTPPKFKHKPPPVHGYRPLPQDAVDLVNVFKVDEEKALRHLDQLEPRDDIDKRWLAIGRTRLQEAYMAIVRSVFQPTRLQLSEPAPPQSAEYHDDQ